MKTTTNIDFTNFINYLTSQSKSPNTISTYITTLKEYFSQYTELTHNNIQLYVQSLRSKNIKATTINNKLSALKTYNTYLVEIKEMDSIVIIQNDFIKTQKQYCSPTKITKSDTINFFNKIKSNESKRNIALIYLIINTGIRISECINIKLTDLFLKESKLIIRSGKGNKERTVLLDSDTIDILKDYINTDRKTYKLASKSEYLFVSLKGDKLRRETINLIMSKYSKDITPHQLRHLFASRALESGMNLVEVANLLGHESIVTTTLYTNPTEEEMRKKINKMNYLSCK